jgi:hypothetical protein
MVSGARLPALHSLLALTSLRFASPSVFGSYGILALIVGVAIWSCNMLIKSLAVASSSVIRGLSDCYAPGLEQEHKFRSRDRGGIHRRSWNCRGLGLANLGNIAALIVQTPRPVLIVS